MSRIYFHTQTNTAELAGSERGWLRFIAMNAVHNWWGLDEPNPLDRALDIAGMIVPNSCGQYVRTAMVDSGRYSIPYPTDNHVAMIKDYAQQALDDRIRYETTWKRYVGAETNPVHNFYRDDSSRDRLVDILRTCLKVSNVPLQIGEHIVFSMNVEFNTALTTGNYAVCLAAKIHGWCEIHPWIEESDREFFASLIEESLRDGVYRTGIWYSSYLNGERTWQSQGWENVVALLRDTSTHPGPVVLSTSTSDQFPDPQVSTLMPPWPAGVPENWDALSTEQQEERRSATSRWYDLPDDQKWETCMAGIRAQNPWANITPDNLNTTMFGPEVSLFDLFHPDRIERINAAFGREPADEDEEDLFADEEEPCGDSLEDDEDEMCGETFDHDEDVTYDGPDGLQWVCRRCGAEGYQEAKDQ